jgi:hypothetical protein
MGDRLHLRRRGVLAPGQTEEEVVVIAGRLAAHGANTARTQPSSLSLNI